MIIPDDKRKAMTVIMSKRSPKGEPLGSAPMKPEIVKTENGELDHRHSAAQDIMAAHHEASPEKLMQALGNFIDLHGAKASKPE